MKTKPTSPKGQCQFAETAKDKPRCQKPATRLWGGNWFCDEHGTETHIIMTNERRQMNDDEINAAIAESTGIVSKDQHGKLYHTEKGYVRDCPNYHGSLDAIVPVVRAMTPLRKKAVLHKLFNLTGSDYVSLATPAQWCEAYLKAEGLRK